MNDKTTVQVRVSILNTPEWISPLKFRGWLIEQAEQIQAMTVKNGFTIIRLHITERLRFQMTQQKLDKVLQKIVDKYPAIYRIELHSGTQSLSLAEMKEEESVAREYLDSIGNFIEEDKLH